MGAVVQSGAPEAHGAAAAHVDAGEPEGTAWGPIAEGVLERGGFNQGDLAQRRALLARGGKLAAAMRALEARDWRPLDDADLLVLAWRWVLWLAITRGMAEHTTVARYAEILRRFAAHCRAEGWDWREVTIANLDEWQRALYLERRNSPSARQLAIMALRSFYGFRASRGWGRDCTIGSRGPRQVSHKAVKYSKAQLRVLLTAAQHARSPIAGVRDYTILLLLLSTGLRRAECADLRLAQIDLDERVGLVRIYGKGAKEREVSIEGPVVTALLGWLEARSHVPDVTHDRLFVALAGKVGAPISEQAIERVTSRAARQAKLGDWGVHRFRVTFATALYDAGTDIERIRILLGHEDINTTRRYLEVSDKMRRHRVSAAYQHEVLGTKPAGYPLWAKANEKQRNRGDATR